MRLLRRCDTGDFSLTQFSDEAIPPYAILSHTWGADHDEVTFNDLQNGSGKSKAGYAKIQFCVEQAKKDGLQYFWVDTCCIKISAIVILITIEDFNVSDLIVEVKERQTYSLLRILYLGRNVVRWRR